MPIADFSYRLNFVYQMFETDVLLHRTMLREWATATFQSATDYWTFRKVITLQLALAAHQPEADELPHFDR